MYRYVKSNKFWTRIDINITAHKEVEPQHWCMATHIGETFDYMPKQ